MTKLEKQKLQEELKQEADLVNKSVDFWAQQIDKVFLEMDALEEFPDAPGYEEKSIDVIRRLEYLIKKAETEEKAISSVEKKLYKLMSKKDSAELRARLNKERNKRKES